MGAIKFPHTSGNSMSIAAPATNPASDLELKLPATIGSANQYLKNSGTAGTLEFGSLPDTGKVLKAAYTSTSNSTNISGTSSNVWISGMELSFTPTSASSKIWVISQLNVRLSAVNTSYYGNAQFTLVHDAADAESMNLMTGTGSGSSQGFIWSAIYTAHFDANDTDARDVKLKGRNLNYISPNNNGHIVVNEQSGRSSLLVLEVDES
jgi:hypothetical protein